MSCRILHGFHRISNVSRRVFDLKLSNSRTMGWLDSNGDIHGDWDVPPQSLRISFLFALFSSPCRLPGSYNISASSRIRTSPREIPAMHFSNVSLSLLSTKGSVASHAEWYSSSCLESRNNIHEECKLEYGLTVHRFRRIAATMMGGRFPCHISRH